MVVIVSNILHGLQVVLLDLTATAILVTFATTLLSTLMIVYRIKSTVEKGCAIQNKMPKRIVELLIQSAAIYAAVSLLWAISIIGLAHTETNLSWFVIGYYADALFNSFAVCDLPFLR